MVAILAARQAGPEREDVGRVPQVQRFGHRSGGLVAVDRRLVEDIEHRFHTHVGVSEKGDGWVVGVVLARTHVAFGDHVGIVGLFAAAATLTTLTTLGGRRRIVGGAVRGEDLLEVDEHPVTHNGKLKEGLFNQGRLRSGVWRSEPTDDNCFNGARLGG